MGLVDGGKRGQVAPLPEKAGGKKGWSREKASYPKTCCLIEKGTSVSNGGETPKASPTPLGVKKERGRAPLKDPRVKPDRGAFILLKAPSWPHPTIMKKGVYTRRKGYPPTGKGNP